MSENDTIEVIILKSLDQRSTVLDQCLTFLYCQKIDPSPKLSENQFKMSKNDFYAIIF